MSARLARGAALLLLVLGGCMKTMAAPPTTPAGDVSSDPMPSPSPHAPAPPPAGTSAAPDGGATTPGGATVRIAAGATAAYSDPEGRLWAADSGFSGGVAYTATTPVAIAGTDAAALYNSERYGQANNAPASFGYAIAVPNGAYVVRLGFAELFATAAGQRLFDVSIDGQKVLTAFDIYAAAGAMNSAVVRSFPVTVADGMVQLSFDPGAAQNPKVNTIEIVPASAVDGG